MLRYIIYFCGISIPGVFMEWVPTKGEVWPSPQYQFKKSTFYAFNPQDFEIKVIDQTCTILSKAINRYEYALNQQYLITQRHTQQWGNQHDKTRVRALRQLRILLTKPCEDYPHLDMDESYNLNITVESSLQSASIWGILRGLETFLQLFYLSDDYKKMFINETTIRDFPQYSYRGLLLDTSRHFISLKNILTTIDAMAINKMNVFHWHIVDDQSFPYQSEKFPELSKKGAYHSSLVYTKSDIQRVVEFARDRGVRVLPEFDVPGHTRSWGSAYPSILTECYNNYEAVGLGPMNPVNNATYKLLRDLIVEVQEWFPDKYYHFGFDEVNTDCWETNPELIEYVKHKNGTFVKELYSLFIERVIPLLGNRSKPIVWQDVLDANVSLPLDTLVQVWKGGREINSILSAGYKVVVSHGWYLDPLTYDYGRDWEEYYKRDPRTLVTNAELENNIVGGEACMWSENVDDANVISKVWPSASAIAEVLWSAPKPILLFGAEVDNARPRLEEHTCRMNRRGVAAQPANGPGYCVV